jgi:hypothetical protein
VVFALSPSFKLLAKNPMGAPIYGTATAAGNVLYVATQTHLFAIAEGK